MHLATKNDVKYFLGVRNARKFSQSQDPSRLNADEIMWMWISMALFCLNMNGLIKL